MCCPCAVLCYVLLQGVVVDGEGTGGTRGVQLLRVPSAVRELLPSKPYQAPETNPLPGAETEPDCCSICLVELEAGEQVTVLPCMHFYHKVGSELQPWTAAGRMAFALNAVLVRTQTRSSKRNSCTHSISCAKDGMAGVVHPATLACDLECIVCFVYAWTAGLHWLLVEAQLHMSTVQK